MYRTILLVLAVFSLAVVACSSTSESTIPKDAAPHDGGAGGSATNCIAQWVGPDGKSVPTAGRVDVAGSCCTGCITADGICIPQKCENEGNCGDRDACGHHGDVCVSCDDLNQCTYDNCGIDSCVHLPIYAALCDEVDGGSGQCSVDFHLSDVSAGACCPFGTCLQISGMAYACLSGCPDGEMCHPDYNSCVPNGG